MANLSSDQIRNLRLEIQQISSTLESRASNPTQGGLNRARTVMEYISSMPCTQDPERLRQQLLLVEALQHLAYTDPDQGGVKDIAEWCVQRWLKLQQHYPENWQVLQGKSFTLGYPIRLNTVRHGLLTKDRSWSSMALEISSFPIKNTSRRRQFTCDG